MKSLKINPNNNKVYVYPLKICTRYDPPTIAFIYKYSNSDKQYLHTVEINNIEDYEVEKLYDDIIAEHYLYANPTYVSKRQVNF